MTDEHPSVEDDGSGSDIRIGVENGDTSAFSRRHRLTPEQATKLDGLLRANETWGYAHNCCSWARDTVDAVTGVHLNADGPGVQTRFAQADGYGLKEGALDARTAANTPAQQSEDGHGRCEKTARTSDRRPDGVAG